MVGGLNMVVLKDGQLGALWLTPSSMRTASDEGNPEGIVLRNRMSSMSLVIVEIKDISDQPHGGG